MDRLSNFVKKPAVSVEQYGTKECAESIRDWMRKLDFENVTLFEGNGNPTVFGKYRETSSDKKTLLLFGSYDSNPVEEDQWSFPPYEGQIVEKETLGKCMVGRGVNNKMKFTAMLNAIEALTEVTDALPVNLLMVLDGEEEMFSPSLPSFVSTYQDELMKADALYMPFGSQNSRGVARVQLGYKGIAYIELESSGGSWGRGPSNFEIHSMHRPVVDNPAIRLVKALSTMISDDGNEVLIDGFDEDIKELDEPFLDLVDKLAQDFNVEGYKEGLGVQNLIGKDEKPRDVLERLFSTAQINIDGIWGGYTGPGAEAVIPPKAHAKLEVRLIPNQQSDKVIQCMEDHLTHHGYSDITIEKLAGVEYCLSSIEERIAQSLINAYRDIGAEAQIWPSSIATIPIYLFNREPLGIPFATGCVGYGGHSHGPDEYAVIEGKGKIEGLAGYEKLISSVILEYAR